MHRPSVSALLLLRYARERKVAVEDVLRGSGLTERELTEHSPPVPAAIDQLLVRNFLAAHGAVPGLGLELGLRYGLAAYGVWGLAMASAPTLIEGLRIGHRYIALTYSDLNIQLRESGDCLEVSMDDAQISGAALRRFMVERDIASFARLLSELSNTVPRPVQIELRHAEAGLADQWRGIFGVTPEFSARHNRVRVRLADLQQTLPQADALMAAMAEAQCRRLLATRQALGGVAGQIRTRLLQAPEGTLPSLEALALSMHCTSRTLRRWLRQEGTSYRALLEEFRQMQAAELEQIDGMKTEEIAFRLGYSEAAGYLHARRRWSKR